MKILILGGTTEASAIARGLAVEPGTDAVLSLAGRTRAPVLAAVPARRGGFGGIEGLMRYLEENRIDAVIDATHPFAAQMSRHAEAACAAVGVARVAVVRPAWKRCDGDRWTDAPDMRAAVAALGTRPLRVFLTVGQQELAPFQAAPWHDYLIRSVEAPDPAMLPPRARCIAARGPFEVAAEWILLANEAVEVLVTKNSGGTATAAKLVAARTLGLPVVMVARPPEAAPPIVTDAAQALDWVRHQASASAWRGV